MNDHHCFSSTSDSENLKMIMQRHLKIFVSLLMYLRRLFAAFLSNFKRSIKNRWKLAAFTIILPFIAYFIMAICNRNDRYFVKVHRHISLL